MVQRLLLYLFLSFAAKLVEYRLAYNYGQVFHDFSGNYQDGVNGLSSTTTTADTSATDRGAAFTSSSNIQITLPSNDQQSSAFTLPPTFTIASWFLSKSNTGQIFYRYKDANNYFYLSRANSSKKVNLRIVIAGNDSGVKAGPSSSFTTSNFYLDVWILVALVMSGNSVQYYQNNVLQLSVSLPGGATSYVETGTYSFIIGAASSPVQGIMWYFVITDDSSFQNSLIVNASTTNCLTTTCLNISGGTLSSYLPATVDPYAGTGYMSALTNNTVNSANMLCIDGLYGCYGCVNLICGCSTGSCYFDTDSNTNMCWCPTGSISTASDCTCDTGYYLAGSVCCESSCATCNSGTSTCLTCLASNASPDATEGCDCDSGYFGTKPLNSSTACTACYSECATCNQTSVCLTCIASNASPDVTQGCKCNSGYYGTGPLSTEGACTACYADCATCTQANVCATCLAKNASPDAKQGCNCDSGYYGTAPLTSSGSCTSCYSGCATCVGANICSTCVASNASPDASQGCDCNSGFYGTKPLTSASSCTACYSECITCSQASICLSCIATGASPDSSQGCNCQKGYYGARPLSTAGACSSACYSECATCTEASICSTCVASNASPNSSQGCNCNTGYWGTAPLTSSSSCIACGSDCLTCNQASICLSCVVSNATPLSSGGCACATGYWGKYAGASLSSCTACYSECSTCSQANTCTDCISTNAVPNTSTNTGCVCNGGFWGTSPLTSKSSCTACYSECSTCSQASICLTCVATNAAPDSTQGCDCKQGYYGTRPLSTSGACSTACYSECATCNEASICTTCIASNASPNSSQGCTCNTGYWGKALLTSSSSCIVCSSDCLTCNQASICLSCVVSNATPLSSGGCACATGYWGKYAGASLSSCTACYSECSTCSQANTCTACISPNAVPNTGTSTGCVCSDGFWGTSPLTSQNSCTACYVECSTCKQTSLCLTCMDPNASPTSVMGCTCNAGYSSTGILSTAGSCSQCHPDCAGCLTNGTCVACIAENSSPYSNIGCKCSAGHHNSTSLDSQGSCVTCTEKDAGTDCDCDPLCTSCYGSGVYNCFTCEYYLLGGVCLLQCPLGYEGAEKECRLVATEQSVVHFLFESVGSVYVDCASNLTALGVSKKTGRRLQDDSVITSPGRGVYFTGTGVLAVDLSAQVYIFGTNFSISVWANPSHTDGILLYKTQATGLLLELSMQSLVTQFQVGIENTIYTLNSTNTMQINAWNHILVAVEYIRYSLVTLTVNGFASTPQLVSVAPFLDSLSSSFCFAGDCGLAELYVGFVYEIEIYPYVADVNALMSTSCFGCNVCSVSQICIPSCSVTEYYSVDAGECVQCPTQCSSGCVSSSDCSLCEDSNCVSCSSPAVESCTQCSIGYVPQASACAPCSQGYYYNSDTMQCNECTGLCLTCQEPIRCSVCKDMSQLDSTGQCQCILGYSGNSECIRNIFTASLSIKEDNLVKIIFSEPLRASVKNSEVRVILYGISLEFIVNEIDLSTITLNITFVSEITANSQVIIQFTGEIVSVYNSILSSSKLTGELFMSDEYVERQSMEAKTKAAAQLGKNGATIGLLAAMGASLLSINPRGIFNYLNNAEIFYTIYLYKVDFYPVFGTFLVNTKPQSLIPNPLTYVIDVDEGIQMSTKYQSYGANTNLFLLNAGESLCAFVLFIIIFIIALLLNCTQCLKGMLSNLLYSYKFGFFLRYWLQSFLVNSMSCFLGIKYSKLENNLQIADFSLCILISVIYK